MKALLLPLLLVGFLAHADNKATTTDTTPTANGAAPEWMKYTTPGPAHKNLEPLVGHFNYKMKMWEAPKAKPMESTGTSDNTWVLGGRYIQQEVKGTAMGQPFEGIGFMAYDNFTGQHQMIWMDSMSTAIMHTSGASPATAKTIKQEGMAPNPMKGLKEQWFRNETRIVSKNENVYTMYSKDDAGKEYKTLEIVYKRAKAPQTVSKY